MGQVLSLNSTASWENDKHHSPHLSSKLEIFLPCKGEVEEGMFPPRLVSFTTALVFASFEVRKIGKNTCYLS